MSKNKPSLLEKARQALPVGGQRAKNTDPQRVDLMLAVIHKEVTMVQAAAAMEIKPSAATMMLTRILWAAVRNDLVEVTKKED